VLDWVPLGDSYTIGTSVAETDRWPSQVAARLPLRVRANLAVNGATSRDVIDRQLPRFLRTRPGFGSLLVGVNDVIQGVALATYRSNVATILDAVLGLLPPSRILVVSTPDYTLTPQGANYGDPEARRASIVTFNAAATQTAEDRHIAFVDVFDLSARAATDRSLVAPDGLHPSAAQYRLWVDRIAPVVEALLAA
jgi:lysophospholipase L1-like esterase